MAGKMYTQYEGSLGAMMSEREAMILPTQDSEKTSDSDARLRSPPPEIASRQPPIGIGVNHASICIALTPVTLTMLRIVSDKALLIDLIIMSHLLQRGIAHEQGHGSVGQQ
jgi:hypothetical protein